MKLAVLAVCCLTALLVAAQEPATFYDLMAQASAAREQNDVPRAIELYSQAVKLNPASPDGWWFLGSLQYAAGSYAAARDVLTHVIELTPAPGPAFALRGLSEFEIGEYEQSLADIRHSLGTENQPRNEQVLRYCEGLLLTRLGRFDDALKIYAFLAQSGITNPEMPLAIGLAGLRMPLLPKDLGDDQKELLAETGKAAVQFMAGDDKAGKEAFQTLFRRFPNVANIHSLYGYLLLVSDPDAALGEFKQELVIDPASENALVMTAWSLLMRKQPSDALPYAQRAVGKAPERAASQLVLGRSLAEIGNLREGIEHLEHGLHVEPQNLEIHIALAAAYSRSGRTEDAQRERLCLLKKSLS